jgi:hypothetical protein
MRLTRGYTLDKDEAFKWLNTAYQERDLGLLSLKTDFRLDPLRSDPHFAELVSKVGLPQLSIPSGKTPTPTSPS